MRFADTTIEKKCGGMSEIKSMKNKKHLPMMGVGPVYVIVIIAITVAAVIMGKSAVFEKGMIPSLKIPLSVMGILMLILGIFLWAGAMFHSKIDSHIVENKLVSVAGNIFFLPLFFLYWIFMTVLMKCTEEKWLRSLYGSEYEEYCNRVNRCIP